MRDLSITRRSFLKTSAFATGSYLVLSRGTALASPGSGASGDGSFVNVTFRQFRLMCVEHPEVFVGQAAWLEAENPDDLSKPSPHGIKVEADGPFRGQHFRSRQINATWTSSLTPSVSEGMIHRLVLGDRTYDGRWIKDGDPKPVYVMERREWSPGLPPGNNEFGFYVKGSQVYGAVTKAGFFIGNLVVSGGRNIETSTTYETSDGETATSEKGAEAKLGLPDVSAGGSVSPKSISAKLKIQNESGFSIKTSGTSVVQKQYSVREGGNGTSHFAFDGVFSSTMAAEIKMDWKIIVQEKTRTYRTLDGNVVRDLGGTDWSPPLPGAGVQL